MEYVHKELLKFLLVVIATLIRIRRYLIFCPNYEGYYATLLTFFKAFVPALDVGNIVLHNTFAATLGEIISLLVGPIAAVKVDGDSHFAPSCLP